MNTHQLWRIDDVSPSFHGRASMVGNPTREADAKRRARRHNESSIWRGYPTRWVALPVGEEPPEAVVADPPALDAESLAYIRKQAAR